jgi:crooked neck
VLFLICVLAGGGASFFHFCFNSIYSIVLGMCGKDNIFKGYIELELQLGEVDRCRNIYSKYIAHSPHCCLAWIAFAQLELNVGEAIRAR